MPTLIAAPTIVESVGNKPKVIREFIGRVNSDNAALSIAQMHSPGGWIEPGQTPEFDEYTLVIRGLVQVRHAAGTIEVRAGQAFIAHAGEWIQYSTPELDGAEYVAVCLPAFSPQLVHRDADD
jgi:quercetin dioxygenase-like cupin family protein